MGAFMDYDTHGFATQVKMTLETNYWATKAACNILFPALKPGARVVNLSSALGFLGKLVEGVLRPDGKGGIHPGDKAKAQELTSILASNDLTYDKLDSLMKDFEDSAAAGDYETHGWLKSSYIVSKIALSALTRIQSREMEGDEREDIAVNHVHPGFVATDINKHMGHLTADKGAKSAVYAALLPAGSGVRGEFIWHDCQL